MRTLLKAAASGMVLAIVVAACGSSAPSADTQAGASPTAAATDTLPTATRTRAETVITETVTSPAITTTRATPSTLSTVSVTTPDTGGAGIETITGTDTTTSGACTASDLSAAAVSPNSAPGTTVLGFTLTNTGSSPCHTYGWPGIELLGTQGQPLPTDSIRTTSDVLGSTPELHIELSAGEQASFRLTFNNSNGTAANTGCDVVAGVQIIAPDDTATLKASLPEGQTVDDCGTVKISPLQPGTSGTGQ